MDYDLGPSSSYFASLPHMAAYVEGRHKSQRELDFTVPSPIAAVSTPGWRICYANARYELSTTYPAILAVPLEAVDPLVVESADFRSNGRLPVLCWRSPRTGVSLSRCAQPCAGLTGRSKADQVLVEMIRQVPPEADRLFIFDARPRVNAMVNKAMGKGVESASAYVGTKLIYLSIQNIQLVRDSHAAMRGIMRTAGQVSRYAATGLLHSGPALRGVPGSASSQGVPAAGAAPVAYAADAPVDAAAAAAETANQSIDGRSERLLAPLRVDHFSSAFERSFLQRVEATKWPEFVRSILCGAQQITTTMTRLRCHAVAHCSDGWDRTPQLTATAMLLMDPFYRTLRGFCLLVEKEWASFGHKFSTRARHFGTAKAMAFGAEADDVDDHDDADGATTLARQRSADRARAAATGFSRRSTSQEGPSAFSASSSSPSEQDHTRPVTSMQAAKASAALNAGSSSFNESQASPTFIQWLDCIFQIISQHPREFEFTEALLLHLAHAAYSCRYGTFLFDCEHDRVVHSLARLTESVWDPVLADVDRFTNPYFSPLPAAPIGEDFLPVSPAACHYMLWTRYWLQHMPDSHHM
jgi:hypothetical protein